MKKIAIKDLSSDIILDNQILCIPLYVRKKQPKLLPKMIIRSGWNKGFWCVKKQGDGRLFPVFFENWDEVKEWKIKAENK